MLRPSLNHRTLLPYKCTFPFAVVTKFRVAQKHETAHNNIYGVFYVSRSGFQENTAIWFLLNETRLATPISTDVLSVPTALISVILYYTESTWQHKYIYIFHKPQRNRSFEKLLTEQCANECHVIYYLPNRLRKEPEEKGKDTQTGCWGR